MATLYVSYIGGVSNGVANNPLGCVTVTTSTTSAKTTGNANRGAALVSVFSDTAHYVTAGPSASVVATAANSIYVPANVERHLAIDVGEEIAAITLA